MNIVYDEKEVELFSKYFVPLKKDSEYTYMLICNERAHNIYSSLLCSANQDSNRKKNWSNPEINLLNWALYQYYLHHQITPNNFTDTDWSNIASFIPGRKLQVC